MFESARKTRASVLRLCVFSIVSYIFGVRKSQTFISLFTTFTEFLPSFTPTNNMFTRPGVRGSPSSRWTSLAAGNAIMHYRNNVTTISMAIRDMTSVKQVVAYGTVADALAMYSKLDRDHHRTVSEQIQHF